jgi:rRNA maturation protein Nop10
LSRNCGGKSKVANPEESLIQQDQGKFKRELKLMKAITKSRMPTIYTSSERVPSAGYSISQGQVKM